MVLGSTGSKYVVTLADKRHTCKCMDFRIRQRPCKHIRLVLQQLGIADSPADWHQVTPQLGFKYFFCNYLATGGMTAPLLHVRAGFLYGNVDLS